MLSHSSRFMLAVWEIYVLWMEHRPTQKFRNAIIEFLIPPYMNIIARQSFMTSCPFLVPFESIILNVICLVYRNSLNAFDYTFGFVPTIHRPTCTF